MNERFEQAVRVLREHVARNRDDLDLRHKLLATLLEAGCADHAADEFEGVVRERPGLTQYHYDLLARLHAAGHEPALRRALDAAPGVPPARRAMRKYGCGLLHQAAGRQEDAAAEYRRAIEAEPGFAAAHYNLGNAMNAQGQLDRAAECLRTAIRLGPQMAEPHFALGGILMKQRNFRQAREHFERFVALAQPYHAPYVHNARQMLTVISALEKFPD